MKAHIDSNSRNIDVVSPEYRSAVTTAIVGGVFSLIALGLVVLNYFQSSVVEPRRTEKLDTLKIEVRDQLDNEQLLSRIRKLDLQIRKDRIRRRDSSRKGGYLLLGGVVVFVIGLKWAGTFRKKLPSPRPKADEQEEQICKAMWSRRAVTACLVVLGTGALLLVLTSEAGFIEGVGGKKEIQNWPRFRGPGGLGISVYTNIPSRWNGKTGEGILWKSKVPLSGHNSPVVWGDRVFLAGADANSREVYCFDAFSGDLLWQKAVVTVEDSNAAPFEIGKETSYAAPTVATDGRRIYAIFPTGDVGCFSINGNKLWTKSLGIPDSAYGYASSLAMYKHLLLIQYDQASAEDEKSKLIALDGFSGQTAWETKRPVGASWTSPILAKVGDGHQVITWGEPWVIAYNPINGAELWRVECLGVDLAPSPIYANGLVFGIEPYNRLVAIRPDGQGDVTKTHIVWIAEDGIPDICSPVSNGKLIFLLTTEGTITCYKVKDGKKLWDKELDEDFLASPSLVGNRLYLLSEEGVMYIIEVGTEYKELARCELGENCNASPAFADGCIYIRGQQNLYCISNRSLQTPLTVSADPNKD